MTAPLPILSVRNLRVQFETDNGTLLTAVDDVSFDVREGTCIGIVGESGCGKSVTALSITGLLPKPAGRVASGEIFWEGENLLETNEDRIRQVRGQSISMVFQEPMTALNPVHRIGRQVAEAVLLHEHVSTDEAMERAIHMLELVGLPRPRERFNDYPHQLSGGMRQRVVIAAALVCKPRLLIADEPTTALDVTVQAQILDLLKQLQKEMGLTVILITHDLGVVAEFCDDVVVMYAGHVAEHAKSEELFGNPRHPYTQGLLRSMPTLESQPKTRLPTIPGMVPGLANMPSGCRFRNRCEFAIDECENERPPLTTPKSTKAHTVACIREPNIPVFSNSNNAKRSSK